MRGRLMRRILSGGVLLSLGLVAAHAAVEAWMEARAVLALEEASRRLPEGSRLVWDRLDAQPLRLAVVLEGVRLALPPGGAVRGLEVGSVRLAQATGRVDSLGRTGSVRAGELRIELAEGRGTLQAAEVEGDAVEIEALQRALAAPDPLAALGELRLGPVRARDATLEAPGGRLVVPRIAIGGYAERRLEGLALEGLAAEGRAGGRARLDSLEAGLLDLRALEPAALAAVENDPAGLLALIDRLAIEAVRLRGLEFRAGDDGLRLSALGLERAGSGRIENFALDGLAIDGEGKGRGELGHLSLALLDWSRVRLDRLAAAAARLGEAARDAEEEDGDGDDAEETEPAQDPEDGGEATAEAGSADQPPSEPGEPGGEAETLATSFAGLELAGELLELRIGPIRLDRLAAGDRQAGLALRHFSFDGLEAGRLGALSLEGFEARGEEGWAVRLAAYEQSAVTVGPADLAARVEAAPRTTEGLQALTAELARLPWQGSSALTGLALEKDGRTGFAAGRFAVALDETGPRKRTRVSLDDLVVDPGVLGDEQAAASRQWTGTDRIELRARLATLYDEASREVALEELSFDAARQLAVRLSFLARLGADPAVDPVTASTDAELVRAELELRDQGAIDRFLAGMEQQMRKKRPELVKQLVRDFRREEPGRSLLDQKRAAELEKFLLKPRVLVIRLVPAEPVSFLAGFMGAVATPGQAVKTLGLSIEARGD